MANIVKRTIGGGEFWQCLWHEDETPSMRYYPKSDTLFCFTCRKYVSREDYLIKLEGKRDDVVVEEEGVNAFAYDYAEKHGIDVEMLTAVKVKNTSAIVFKGEKGKTLTVFSNKRRDVEDGFMFKNNLLKQLEAEVGGCLLRVFLVEGPGDVLACERAGFPAVCYGGIPSVEKVLALRYREVCVLLDSDKAGLKGAMRIMNSINSTPESVRFKYFVCTGVKDPGESLAANKFLKIEQILSEKTFLKLIEDSYNKLDNTSLNNDVGK